MLRTRELGCGQREKLGMIGAPRMLESPAGFLRPTWRPGHDADFAGNGRRKKPQLFHPTEQGRRGRKWQQFDPKICPPTPTRSPMIQLTRPHAARKVP